ncbi:MAG TPA: hypothetical protein VN739_08660, partial [Nitrososphaerales archaeon]|nr:hypothetical protein [Nitrososphaerales archaeon]
RWKPGSTRQIRNVFCPIANNLRVLLAQKNRIVEILCLIGIVLLLHSASRTLIVLGIGSGSYYFGLQGAFAPFENIEGFVGAILAMNPLFLLAFART